MFIILLYLQLTSSFHANAFASLGDHVDAIEKDRIHFAAKRADTEKHASFSVHELTTDGIKLREFTDSSGKIFAIKWEGNTHPDLALILGSYNAEYLRLLSDEKEKRSSTRRSVRTAQSSLIGKNIRIEKSGHMRNAQGGVYLPNFFPTGVSLNDLQ